jgi:TRAP-type mannitol/chloroaromatic compound transport system permease small subunit
MLHHTQTLINTINHFNEIIGKLTAWLILMMVLLVGYEVFMRYVWHSPSVAVQELKWHLFGLTFLLGAAYTLKHDEHVRVDILYQSQWMNPTRRAWVNMLGAALLLIPFCLMLLISTWPFVHNAFVQGEGSPDPGGLPYRWLLKSAILVGFALLLLQGVAQFLDNLLIVLGMKAAPLPAEEGLDVNQGRI